jgi:hypothetical protein
MLDAVRQSNDPSAHRAAETVRCSLDDLGVAERSQHIGARSTFAESGFPIAMTKAGRAARRRRLVPAAGFIHIDTGSIRTGLDTRASTASRYFLTAAG